MGQDHQSKLQERPILVHAKQMFGANSCLTADHRCPSQQAAPASLPEPSQPATSGKSSRPGPTLFPGHPVLQARTPGATPLPGKNLSAWLLDLFSDLIPKCGNDLHLSGNPEWGLLARLGSCPQPWKPVGSWWMTSGKQASWCQRKPFCLEGLLLKFHPNIHTEPPLENNSFQFSTSALKCLDQAFHPPWRQPKSECRVGRGCLLGFVVAGLAGRAQLGTNS